MELPQIIDGRLHSGHCIFFRRDPPLSDQQILEHFGLRNHLRADSLPKSCTYAVLADIGEWVLLADDLLYRLWNTPTTAAAVESLAKSRDVFTWSVGDCDMSFGYKVFKDGELIRDYALIHHTSTTRSFGPIAVSLRHRNLSLSSLIYRSTRKSVGLGNCWGATHLSHVSC